MAQSILTAFGPFLLTVATDDFPQSTSVQQQLVWMLSQISAHGEVQGQARKPHTDLYLLPSVFDFLNISHLPDVGRPKEADDLCPIALGFEAASAVAFCMHQQMQCPNTQYFGLLFISRVGIDSTLLARFNLTIAEIDSGERDSVASAVQSSRMHSFATWMQDPWVQRLFAESKL